MRFAAPLPFALFALATGLAAQPMTTRQLLELPQPDPDTVVRYGADSLQFGELFRARSSGAAPVAVLIHGGCWLAQYDRRHVRSLAAAIARTGVTVWSLEYRRLGDPGGGWPGTFTDIAAGVDYVRQLATPFSLDTGRVAVVGHSAGGHLALWVAARRALPKGSPGSIDPLGVAGVVGLAAIPDLAAAASAPSPVCGDAIPRLLGGSPTEVADRYRIASPDRVLPLGVPQILITGDGDRIVPPSLGRAYADRAGQAGDRVRFLSVPNAGHFEVVAPDTPAGRETLAAIRLILGR